MSHLRIFTIIIACIACLNTFGQDTSTSLEQSKGALLLAVNAATYLPEGDLKDRFGPSSSIGGGLNNKTKSNWTFGIQANFQFGKKINEDSLLQNLANNLGSVTDQNGQPSELKFAQRGYNLFGHIGKIIPLHAKNKNAGLWIQGGLGFLQHKIRIDDIKGNTNQLAGDYKSGYDRLTNGLAASQYLGYIFLDKNRMINFHIGFEIIEGFTKNRRKFQFDTMKAELGNRLDIYWGIKLGWFLPFYRFEKDEYYTN